MAQNLEQTLGGLRKTDTFIQEGIQSTGDYALQFLNACPELTGDQVSKECAVRAYSNTPLMLWS